MKGSHGHDITNRRYRIGRRIRHTALLGALVYPGVLPGPHPEGILEPAAKTFVAGDSLSIGGRKFEPDDAVTLLLIGVAGRTELVTAATDSAGAFRVRVLVPASLKPGSYRLVAEAVDGDEVGTVEVMVLAATPEPMENHDPASHAMPAEHAAPTAEPIAVNRAGNIGLRFTAWLTIIAFAGVGLALMRTPEPFSQETQ